MFESLKAKLTVYYDRWISAGYYKATSWWANLVGIVVAGGPDLLNLILQNTDLVTSALPTLSPEHKAQFLLAVNVAALVFRMFRQQSVQTASVKQAIKNGDVVPTGVVGSAADTSAAINAAWKDAQP